MAKVGRELIPLYKFNGVILLMCLKLKVQLIFLEGQLGIVLLLKMRRIHLPKFDHDKSYFKETNDDYFN